MANQSAEMDGVETLVTFEEADIWLHKQLEQEVFQTAYQNKFVGIKENKVVASAKTVEGLVEELKSKNLDPNKVFVEFVYPKGVAIFF